MLLLIRIAVYKVIKLSFFCWPVKYLLLDSKSVLYHPGGSGKFLLYVPENISFSERERERERCG